MINLMKIINDLYPLRRDLVSDGYDQALEYINSIIPLQIHKYPTGTQCWDWIIPPKWEIREAYIKDSKGNTIIDINESPLAVSSYSVPVSKTVTKDELLKHIFTEPNQPDAVPYTFTPYEKKWEFCVPHNSLKQFSDQYYEVLIDSVFEEGMLKVGEYEIKGKSDNIIVVMAHLDHPFQANDDLTGVAITIDLAMHLKKRNNYYTYKFLFVPESIGSIAYLSNNEAFIPKMIGGIFLEKLGNSNDHSIQFSKKKTSNIDLAANYILTKASSPYKTGDYGTILGNDEKIFNSTYVDVPMISITRKPYPEMHTSNDNPKIIHKSKLYESAKIVYDVLILNDNNRYIKSMVKGPICLSRHGIAMNKDIRYWKLLSYLDGKFTILELSFLLKADFYVLKNIMDEFEVKELVIQL